MKKSVKVNPFDPAESGIVVEAYNDGTVKRKSLGVPVRLVLAGQILAGLASNPEVRNITTYSRTALDTADFLIEEHNLDVEDLNEKK